MVVINKQLIIFGKKTGEMKKLYFCFTVGLFFALAACSNKEKHHLIKVVTLNLRYDNPADSINAWPKRSSQVCSFILDEKPDIIGMQEVLYNQYLLLDSVLKDYSSEGVGRDDGARNGEMNPVFFRKDRFDLVRTITFWLSDTPEVPGSKGWGASLPRIVTWMELVDKNSHDHLFFFNTHFAHDSDSARIMSSKILLAQVGRISEGFPFIVTGDFNMTPTSQGYAILTGPDESVPLLKDSFIISEKKPTGPLYTFNGFSDKPGSGRIDYIFIRDGMKVSEHRTLIEKQHDVFLSDHWPVEATISIK
jgi:endonuclease/exonuclease/phosphatase family metal-dependent hydrolase